MANFLFHGVMLPLTAKLTMVVAIINQQKYRICDAVKIMGVCNRMKVSSHRDLRSSSHNKHPAVCSTDLNTEGCQLLQHQCLLHVWQAE